MELIGEAIIKTLNDLDNKKEKTNKGPKKDQ